MAIFPHQCAPVMPHISVKTHLPRHCEDPAHPSLRTAQPLTSLRGAQRRGNLSWQSVSPARYLDSLHSLGMTVKQQGVTVERQRPLLICLQSVLLICNKGRSCRSATRISSVDLLRGTGEEGCRAKLSTIQGAEKQEYC